MQMNLLNKILFLSENAWTCMFLNNIFFIFTLAIIHLSYFPLIHNLYHFFISESLESRIDAMDNLLQLEKQQIYTFEEVAYSDNFSISFVLKNETNGNVINRNKRIGMMLECKKKNTTKSQKKSFDERGTNRRNALLLHELWAWNINA